ncbi:hypothetical protein N9N28_10065 [Rubripirellula amarantea]|nr:hypothetical protein [Rubripirellula amarantea]
MLDFDYPTQLSEMIQSVGWTIELPVEWKSFFDERGEVPSYSEDDRHNMRLKIRTHGLMWFEETLPFCPRTTDPVGVYTRDFSRTGTGFLSSVELYPEETVRVALPTFWVQLKVVRVRRITSKCFEIGASLMKQHDPSPQAFGIPIPAIAAPPSNQDVCS